MPWLSRERRKTEVSASACAQRRVNVRLANNTKRSSKIKVSHREKPKTGQLVFIFRFFTCLQFSPQTCRTLTVDPACVL